MQARLLEKASQFPVIVVACPLPTELGPQTSQLLNYYQQIRSALIVTSLHRIKKNPKTKTKQPQLRNSAMFMMPSLI